MTAPTLTPRAWIDMGLLALIWGASFLSIEIALGEIPFLTLVAHRVFWAACVLWVYVLWRGLPVPRDWRVWGAFVVMGVLNNVLPFSLMAWGQQFIESGLTSIFNAATAIFAVFVASTFFADERLTLRRLVGSALAFLGVAIAIGLDALGGFDLRSMAQLAVLGGALSYAFAAAWARARLTALPPQVAAMGMLTGSSLILLPLVFMIDGIPRLPERPETFAAIGYFSILGTAVAYLLYYRVLYVAGSANAMLVTLMIPPVAIMLGALVLGERLSPAAFAGFAFLAIGLLVVDGRITRRFRRARGTPSPRGPSSAR